MQTLGYLGIDQYGQHYYIRQHPRKELLAELGASKANNMYCDTTDGRTRHVGYVIAGLWIRLHRVVEWKEAVWQ